MVMFCQKIGAIVDRPEHLADQICVERAIAEFRAGRPVLLKMKDGIRIILPAEDLDEESSRLFASVMAGPIRLVITGPRLQTMGAVAPAEAGAILLSHLDIQHVHDLILAPDKNLDTPVLPLLAEEKASLELARLSLMLPAVLTAPANEKSVLHPFYLQVTPEAVLSYRNTRLLDIHITGRAPVPLEGAPETEFVVFRGGEGMHDQIAILVGKPDVSQPVTVRLHSACLTGDLFGSLKCDCGDQLRGTTRWMSEHGGGILLYLDQEGRGNGIANKMRAYALQAKGFDTFDADAALGFGPDQRNFDYAATMLKLLGVSAVRLMTNNPAKIAALEAAQIKVVADVRIKGRMTEENIGYLATKRDKAGHMFESQLMVTLPP
jgi:GTP cyclohydrolase II